MDSLLNPYEPGAGRAPAALVGRDGPLTLWDTSVQRIAAGRGSQPVALYGLRGVGKTVLLHEFGKLASHRNAIVVRWEASAGTTLRQGLTEALGPKLADLATSKAGHRLKKAIKTAATFFNLSVDATGTWSVSINLADTEGGGAGSGALEPDLLKLFNDLSAAAEERETVITILIDEAQDLPQDDLSSLCAAMHRGSQERWRIQVALAGLPSLPRVLSESKSYSERLFHFIEIEALAHDKAREALTIPAEQAGVTWESEAADYVVNLSSGYPYFLQQYGQDSWRAAPGTQTITAADARVGVATGQAALDIGFYRARWDRATPAEKKYLSAMAIDGDGPSHSADIAARLNRTLQSQGPARANLIAKGLIYAPEHGVIAFTVPGMAAFINRNSRN